MITPQELEVFQSCRARWKLAKKDGKLAEPEDSYLFALRKTIFQMYSWLEEKNKFMTVQQVRERWDKNWWATSMDEGILKQDQILDKAANGWMTLEDYWNGWYLAEPEKLPVGVNFEFSVYKDDVHYRIQADLVLSDQDGRFSLRQFGGKKTDWQLYNSLATKLEVISLTDILERPPINRDHIDLISKKTKIDHKRLSITPAYLRNAAAAIGNVSSAIKSDAIYTSQNKLCSSCPYKGNCWF